MPYAQVFRDHAKASVQAADEAELFQLSVGAAVRMGVSSFLSLFITPAGSDPKKSPLGVWLYGQDIGHVRSYVELAGFRYDTAIQEIAFLPYPRHVRAADVPNEGWDATPELKAAVEYVSGLANDYPCYEFMTHGPLGTHVYSWFSGPRGTDHMDAEELVWINSVSQAGHLARARLRRNEGRLEDVIPMELGERQVVAYRIEGMTAEEIEEMTGITRGQQDYALEQAAKKLLTPSRKLASIAAKAAATDPTLRLLQPDRAIYVRTTDGEQRMTVGELT